jgi:hypothetical protein
MSHRGGDNKAHDLGMSEIMNSVVAKIASAIRQEIKGGGPNYVKLEVEQAYVHDEFVGFE